MSLYADNDSNLEMLGLKDEDGNWITSATVVCTVTDPGGNAVATVSLSYLGSGVAVGAYADGNYRGVLAGSNTPALVAGTVYQEHYVATVGGDANAMVVDKYEVAQQRIG